MRYRSQAIGTALRIVARTLHCRRILSAPLHDWSSGDRDVLAGLVSRFAADLPARHRRRLAPASGHR
ncbi:hypothetical protein L3Q67_38365 [Saccharothrix sp. AJ9571]|nr:hypothetical protein L3Q67_38365 [Saccharothrix sp. AJ9571]